ncbi:MAG: hypothetical protein HY088_08030 [Ignavibacteriales bacterium]|nr:hypothetical protein [Ignavibacteriales bacterium]
MKINVAILSVFVLSFCIVFSQKKKSLVNFGHLEHLTEEIRFAEEQVGIVHVYANFPTYEWVEAKGSDTEGIACVDDAARAVVLYLRHFELRKDTLSLAKAKLLLRFVMKMQTDDGMFYNFIQADHSINRDGKTSYKSFGWWAARGVWCFGLGYRVMKLVDPPFADELERRIQRTFPHIDTLLFKYSRTITHGTFKSPQWLLYEEAADATTELLLGLTEYYSASGDKYVKGHIKGLCEGLILMQDGDFRTFPYGLHRSWRTLWHMWGNSQTQALAFAGVVLNDRRLLKSAEKEARSFYSRLLIEGFMKEMDVAKPGTRKDYEQIAYGIRPMAIGLIRLYEATKKEEYLKMAGLAASWFVGNNVLGERMYHPATGRCFDGITDSVTVNKNSGAESTIEALMTILEVERYPQAEKYLQYRKVKSGSRLRHVYAVFQNDAGDELTLVVDLKQSWLLVLEGEKSKAFLEKVK